MGRGSKCNHLSDKLGRYHRHDRNEEISWLFKKCPGSEITKSYGEKVQVIHKGKEEKKIVPYFYILLSCVQCKNYQTHLNDL